MHLKRTAAAGSPQLPADEEKTRPRIRGWLVVYIVGLAYSLAHGTALTIGSIVVYANPALGGLKSYVPLHDLLFYVATNALLIVYGIGLLVLMVRRRRSAIANNVVFNLLSIASLVAWHVLGEKSNIGTLVDSAPNLLGAIYILASRRVRRTFTISARSSRIPGGSSVNGSSDYA